MPTSRPTSSSEQHQSHFNGQIEMDHLENIGWLNINSLKNYFNLCCEQILRRYDEGRAYQNLWVLQSGHGDANIMIMSNNARCLINSLFDVLNIKCINILVMQHLKINQHMIFQEKKVAELWALKQKGNKKKDNNNNNNN
eukprot:61148_1